MEILSFLLPFHLSPFKLDVLPSIFFFVIWGLFFYTIFRVYQTAKPENWEHNWYGGNKNNQSKKLDAEHGSVMEISEAVATPSEKLADIMPGMILIIGLLGTFLGLGLALDKASSILTGANALSNMDASMANLMQMLEGLGTKFKTSTWGLLAFILLKVILSKNGYEERRLRWSIEKVKSELDIVRDQKLQEERNNNNNLIECMQSIAMQFEQTVQKNQAANQDQLKQLTHHTQDTIKTIQLSHDEHLKQLHLNNQENIRALASQSSLIKELTEENQKHHIIYLEQIGKFLLLFEKNSEDRAALLNQKFGVLIQQSDKLLQLIKGQHQETKDLLTENVAQSIETRAAMVEFIAKNEETVVKLGKAAEGMSQAASTMGASATQLQAVIDSFRSNMEDVISLMKEDLNSTISNMNTSFSQNMTKMSDNLKSSIGDMSTSFKKNMSEMSNGLGMATGDISNAVTSLSTSVDKTMNEVTATIGKSMDLQTKAQSVFIQSTNTLNEYIEEMTGLVNKLSGDITGGLKAVSESNRQVIGLGKQIKLSSEDLTQMVGNVFNDLSQNLNAINDLKPTLENLANGIVLQKETLQKIESQNSQHNFAKNTHTNNNKGKKPNSSIAKNLFGFNGVENEG
ncbi:MULTISPECIES: methyl-accepting chemotaxis protein [Acinetobacter]|uniref:hypothetical protein n=1 Tax=Acinetobacter TaxID=469 RepID=UPI00044BBDA3|nr:MULTISPECIES: hypothetical protein [Acinetobacter]EXE12111.1 hypothetical protein J559_3157 [Acinetobacter sp. 983759]MCM1934661.1 hypothetical protein [Acinetobacter radioresistens]MCM1952052.1 hypothetical protein [Acinetobacter radioresistens]MCU4309851.1 hypothetical protein [Acinetobacter radioresistens]MCU4568411.1 hypothetical protein [Acinetobacter radioresistens]